LIIQRDTSLLLERWSRRAVQEQPTARRVHHRALLDHLSDLLHAMGRSLMETDEARTTGHRLPATVHGEDRWETGWSLPEVVRDYQILRLVLLDYLEERLDRPLTCREAMAIGLVLDEAIEASVFMYASSRDRHLKELEEQRAALDKRLQEHLRVQAEALRDSDRRKNEFLATLAHELRNPIAPLRNALGVLYLQPPRDPTLLEIRDIFDRQIQQLSRLLDDLLDVSRIAEGKVVLKKQNVNLGSIVSEAVQMSQPLMSSRQIRLSVALPPDDLWMHGDPARLVQIVANLLNNAAKYTDRGGQVWISAQRDAGEAVLRVRDTGAGISADLLPHIFDLFTQAEWPSDRSQGGLGIGLTLVRKLVELHGGSIVAKSEGPGQGSEFIVRLPVLAVIPAVVLEKQGDQPPKNSLPRRRVLVVDDNIDAAQTLAMLLKLQGQEIQVAYDGLSALQVAESFHPEVVLLDIGLPRMDGYEVARRLREQVGADRVLLAALTGYGQDEDRRRSTAAGFNVHLVKPVSPEALCLLLATPTTSRAPSRRPEGTTAESPGT
jgi:signal transduction histidine kinase/CheY-like chemotaxis protein